MNKQDLNNLIRWAVDTDGIKFAKEIYGRSNPNIRDDYTTGKFQLMHRDIIMWIASLDDRNRQHLADAINNNPTNEYDEEEYDEEEYDDSEDMRKAESRMLFMD